ncbi:hypothetical protein Patl1_17976 [Pistacia atlantica]|uniref:Uncharacterized protein n=1 Tax=Pistacia atlantica TaxID=434234 RepID=A0ACC1C302_9ROSI|nr:hypothetical protein Patl1_17976 [Pistacia atlantica]
MVIVVRMVLLVGDFAIEPWQLQRFHLISRIEEKEEDVIHVGQLVVRGVNRKAYARHRLWRIMQTEVQCSLSTKLVQQGMRDLLFEMQMRPAWDLREQGGVRDLLHRYDLPMEIEPSAHEAHRPTSKLAWTPTGFTVFHGLELFSSGINNRTVFLFGRQENQKVACSI